MSSNYPPGVTGNEPEIAGYDEIELGCHECSADVIAYGSSRSDYYTYECGACGHLGEVIGYWEDQAAESAMEAARDARLGI